MSDPRAVLDGIDRARDAFAYRGSGPPDYEDGVSQADDWETQFTKACRYLESTRSLREQDGYNGAVVELSFGAIERSLEAYVLWDTADDLGDFRDHEEVYDRAVQRGLFEVNTAENLQQLYARNRTRHYYGRFIPTQEKEDAMFHLAREIHQYVVDQIREGGVCTCD